MTGSLGWRCEDRHTDTGLTEADSPVVNWPLIAEPPRPCPPDDRPLLDPASVAPATLSSLPPGRLPPPAMLATVDGSGQKPVLMRGKEPPRAGTAFTDLVPCSEPWVHLLLLAHDTAPLGDSLRRFPEYPIGRARRCFEEHLDRAVGHMHLLWDRRKDTPIGGAPPAARRKKSAPFPVRFSPTKEQCGLTSPAWRESPRSGP